MGLSWSNVISVSMCGGLLLRFIERVVLLLSVASVSSCLKIGLKSWSAGGAVGGGVGTSFAQFEKASVKTCFTLKMSCFLREVLLVRRL